MDPQRCRTGTVLAGRPWVPRLTGCTTCVTGSDGRVSSKFDLHENASRNEVVDGAINLSPLAMPEPEVYEYYLKLLGHERQLGTQIQHGSLLHFTTSTSTLCIGSAKHPTRDGEDGYPGGHEGPGRRDSRHPGALYDVRLPSSISNKFPRSIAINREWRRA
jgi:hypothetical protein